EQDEDDDDEEEEHSASADSIPPPPSLCVTLLSSDRRADRPEVTLPPRKRLSIIHCSRYEAGESSAVAEAEIRRRIAEDIGYGIRDAWIDPRDIAEEEALTTLEGVNTRVTELVAVQEQDTQDIYRVMKDAQRRQTEMFQRVETLVDDSRYHYETGRLVDQEAKCSRDAWTHSIGLSSAVHFELQGYMTHTWGHLVTALGEIQALQAREQARAGTPEGTGSSTRGTWRRCGLGEEMWILLLELVLTFPGKLKTSFRVPSNLNDGNATPL
nr:hypothetical protein [Tanacetum cinerariifolium]